MFVLAFELIKYLLPAPCGTSLHSFIDVGWLLLPVVRNRHLV